MPVSGPQQARRALVKLLLTLAAVYSVRVTVTEAKRGERDGSAVTRVGFQKEPCGTKAAERAERSEASEAAEISVMLRSYVT